MTRSAEQGGIKQQAMFNFHWSGKYGLKCETNIFSHWKIHIELIDIILYCSIALDKMYLLCHQYSVFTKDPYTLRPYFCRTFLTNTHQCQKN